MDSIGADAVIQSKTIFIWRNGRWCLLSAGKTEGGKPQSATDERGSDQTRNSGAVQNPER